MTNGSADPSSWRLVDWLWVICGTLMSLLMAVLGWFQRTMWNKVVALEAARATGDTAVAVLAQKVGFLASAIERLTDEQDSHHQENVTLFRQEQDRTRQWREETVAPLLQKISEDTIRLEGRVENVETRLTNGRNRRPQPRGDDHG